MRSCIDYGRSRRSVGRVLDEGGATEAELAHGVVTPACDVLVVEDGAGGRPASMSMTCRPVGTGGMASHGLEVAVPEPVEVIVPYAYESGLPPALHGPVLEQCAVVVLAERGLRYVQRDPRSTNGSSSPIVCRSPVLCVADPAAHVASPQHSRP